MPLVVIIITIVLLGWFFWASTRPDSPKPSSDELPSPRKYSSEPAFEVKLTRDEVALPNLDEKVGVFSVAGKGTISLHGEPSTSRIRLRIRLTSEKDNKEEPVLVFVGFPGVEKGIFKYEEELEMPYRHSSTDVFRSFAKIPELFLAFPYSGSQLLRFDVEFQEIRKDSPLENLRGFKFSKRFSLRFNNPKEGYIDIREAVIKQERSIQFANVKLAILISRSDGHADEREAAKVRDFVRAILEDENDDTDNLKDEFNRIMRECLAVPASAIPQKISECCREIKDEELSDKLAVLDLLFDVVMSDGIVAGKELDVLEKIAIELNLDHEEYTKRRDKALPISAYEKSVSNEQTNRVLGISDDMSESEIRTRLSKLYREWNAKKASSDGAVRSQAKEMIKLIAEKRAELSGKK